MLSEFCPACFGVLLWSVVLDCRYTPQTTGPCCHRYMFFNWGVFKCNIAHRQSVMVLVCMLYKIKCNPMHPRHGALLVPFVPLRGTRGALVARYFLKKLSQYCRTFIPSKYHCGVGLCFYSMARDWRVIRAGPMLFYWIRLLALFLSSTVYLSLLSFYEFVLWDWGLRTDRVSISLSQPCIADLFQ